MGAWHSGPASWVWELCSQSHRASTQEGPTLGLMLCCHHLGILNSSTVLHWVPQIKGPILRAIHSLWGHCPGSEPPGLSLCLHEQERDVRTKRVALGHPVPSLHLRWQGYTGFHWSRRHSDRGLRVTHLADILTEIHPHAKGPWQQENWGLLMVEAEVD